MKIELRISSLNALELCPARHHLGGDELPESDVAETGTKLAAVLAGKLDESELDSAELETYELLKAKRDSITSRLDADYGEPTVEYRDEEEALTLDIADDWRITGHPDLAQIRGEHALILDDKSGRNAVPHASENLQLLGYALCIAAKHPEPQTFELVVNQPWVKGGGTSAVLTRTELSNAWWRIRYISQRIEAANEQPNPGDEQCRYCSALLCPSRQEEIVTTKRFDLDPVRWAETPANTRLEAYKLACRAGKVAGMMRSLIEAELAANPGEYNGELYLETGNESPVLTDPAGFFQALSEATGIDGSDVSRCAKFRLGDDKATGEPGLDRIVRDKLGTTFGEAKKLVRGLMEAFGTKKQNKPTLKRKDNEE